MKYINFKRYKFSTAEKKISVLKDNFISFFKRLSFERFKFKNLIKYQNIKILLYKFLKKINFLNFKFLFFYLPTAFVFFGFIYLIIPTFYSYDKNKIENIICKSKKIECLIKGEVKYSFYPTPRIKINNLIVNEFSLKKTKLLIANNVEIKLALKNLLDKEKQFFKKIIINNYEINLNLKNYKNYNTLFLKEVNFISTSFSNGKIIFFDDINYLATINDVSLNIEFIENSSEAKLKGKFLNDNIYINLINEINDGKISSNILFKMLNTNFVIKSNLNYLANKPNFINGNILTNFQKNKLSASFIYENDELTIKNSQVQNPLLKGDMIGKIKFIPYFDFDLNLTLENINFTKLRNYFLYLAKNEKKLFMINNKINGNLHLSADKIYSKNNFARSFESRIKFNNGNVYINQFLINLGKLGAADILGEIVNDKKFSNFKFESNIFVDNQRKFLRKLGIYDRENIPPNFFISGNLNLDNPKISFYEIFDNEKYKNEDTNYIEKMFNEIMLQNNYESLFEFDNFKDFVKSITDTTD